jgi:hypothetical protein
MPSDKKNQGRYHLLIIFLIPINLVSFFLSENIIIANITLSLSIVIAYFVLYHPNRKA